MVGGHTVNAAPQLCSTTSQLIVDVVYRHYNADPAQARFVASNNLALSTAGFREIGGFDPTYRTAEDRDLCDRWLHRGQRIVYTAAARVHHGRSDGLCARSGGSTSATAAGRSGSAGGAPSGARARCWWRRDSISTCATGSGFHSPACPGGRSCRWRRCSALWQVTNLAGFVWEKVYGATNGPRDGALSYSG